MKKPAEAKIEVANVYNMIEANSALRLPKAARWFPMNGATIIKAI